MKLPTFIIAGERRSGTTSLGHWMNQHPNIYVRERDPSFFCDTPILGRRTWMEGDIDEAAWAETHSLERYQQLFEEAGDAAHIGEKSADYLYWRPAHSRIASYLPEGRFIFTLRHPVERAWSQYWNEYAKGREEKTFEEAMAAEEERSRRSAYARFHLAYIRRGFYDESLKHFLQFIPPERVLVLILEETQADPAEALRRAYSFIGVDPAKGLEGAGKQLNENWALIPRPWVRRLGLVETAAYAKNKTMGALKRLPMKRFARRRIQRLLNMATMKPAAYVEMKPETRTYLNDIYAPHISSLEDMLERDLSIWRS